VPTSQSAGLVCMFHRKEGSSGDVMQGVTKAPERLSPHDAGAPSVVNCGSGVGATELLKPTVGQSLQLDYEQPVADLARQVAELLADRTRSPHIVSPAMWCVVVLSLIKLEEPATPL